MEKVAVAPLFLFPWSLLPEKLHLLLLEPFLKKKKKGGGGGEGRGGGLKAKHKWITAYVQCRQQE